MTEILFPQKTKYANNPEIVLVIGLLYLHLYTSLEDCISFWFVIPFYKSIFYIFPGGKTDARSQEFKSQLVK